MESAKKIFQFDRSFATKDIVDPARVEFQQYDRIILNGEGTLHHNSRKSRHLLQALREAQVLGVETHIVNTVWQEMPNKYDDVLEGCASISVREVFSQRELKEKHGIESRVKPDLSYFLDVPEEKLFNHVSVYEGQYYINNAGVVYHDPIGNYPRVDIFNMSWFELVNRLRHADLLLTGRHHEMYAAAKAKCRFLIKPGNTWKNEGLFASAGVEIPFDIDGVLSGKYDDQYNQLWNYLDESSRSW